ARQYRTAGILWGYYDDTKVVPYATIVGWSQNVQPQIRRVVAVDGPGTTKLATYIGKPLQEDMKGLGLLVRGMVQEYQGDHEGALESLDQAERLLTQTGHETSLRPVYTLRGRAYFLLGQLPQAKDAYTRAIEAPGEEKDPLLAFAYNGRGAIRFLQGDAEGALADLNKALAIMPDHIQARFNRALVYLSTGDAASALPDAQRTVELAPGFQRAQLLLAACYIDLDRSDEAASLLKAYLKRYPDDANAHYLHGVALTMQGELTAAMDEITTALEAAPDYVDALYQRAAILEKQGNLQEAHETYEQVVALCRSDSATVPYLRIQCDRHLAAAEEAIERLRSR
ncbi:MAG TPA: tetratricopeptide repeat protein, partial [Caldilineae bacterium]|nr:tetratricopeptide repeat protein [Caldilineae bacterium]